MPEKLKFYVGFLLLLAVASAFLTQETSHQQVNQLAGLLKLKSILRNIDGSENNQKHSDWGRSYTNLRRKAPARYQDGKNIPLNNLPNPRFLSQSLAEPSQQRLTMLWGTWGQFLDHDITLSNEGETEEVVIDVPRCDQYYDKECTGNQTINFHRSEYDLAQQVRTNLNQLTAWIDASMVYGSTKQVADSLRTFSNGKLKTSPGDLLPIDQDGFFYAGDIRAIQNMGLTTFHVLFLREHNRLCDLILQANKAMSDEQIYNTARNYVIGLIQKISMYDYLPNLFGKQYFHKYVGDYKGYDQTADPTIFTEFSSTAYRIGHPYVPNIYKAVNNNNQTVEEISLTQLFFTTPQKLTYFRVNTILKGLAFTLVKNRTLQYVDQLRNIPSDVLPGNQDLFAINVFRSRDHGIADYNTLREVYGLQKYQSFSDIFHDQFERFIIEKSFNTIDNIDAYIGVLGEPKLPESMFGELGATIAGTQFKNIRNGDRFWFQYAYPPEVVEEIKKTTLIQIIERNTQVRNLPIDGFFCFDCSA